MAFAHKALMIAYLVSAANDDAALSEAEACNRVRAWLSGPGKPHVNAMAFIAIDAISEAYLELQRYKLARGRRA